MTNAPQQIQTPDQLFARCKACAMALGWKFPFFFPAIARVIFIGDKNTPTASVDLHGKIRVGLAFAATLSDPELMFVIAHEIMHLLLLHADRRGHRDPLQWNIANDLLINHTLKRAADAAGSGWGVFAMPKVGIIATDAQAQLTSEQLYSELPPPTPQMRAAALAGHVPVGQGCGALDAADDGSGVDVDPELSEAEASSLRRQWREVAEQAKAQGRDAGKNAGTSPGNILADILEVPLPKVRWAQVMRGALNRAVSEAGYDDVSWSRRSRRSTTFITLPGGITHRCKAAVVIDTSGSMSDEMLQRCVSETAAIVNNTRVPVFLVVHDHQVQASAWLQPGGRGQVIRHINKHMKGRGGTDFTAAYALVDEKGPFNVMVHLTDGEVGLWPPKPKTTRRLVVALLENDSESICAPAHTRIIEVEL